MSQEQPDPIGATEVWTIRLASYPNWNKPAAERLQAVKCALKHYGFRPLSIVPDKGGEGNSDA